MWFAVEVEELHSLRSPSRVGGESKKAASTGVPFERVSFEIGVVVPPATGVSTTGDAPRITVGVALGPGPSLIADGSVGIGVAFSKDIAVSVTSMVGMTNGVGEDDPGRVQARIAPTNARNARRLRGLFLNSRPVTAEPSSGFYVARSGPAS